MSEDKSSDGFFIITILIVLVFVIPLVFARFSDILKTILFWFLGIFLTAIFLVIILWLLFRLRRKRRFHTSAKLELFSNNKEQNLQLGVIEILSLPQWCDISEVKTQSEIEELNIKQFQATEVLMRNCISSQLPFGMMLLWSENKSKIFFWTSALDKQSTNKSLLICTLEQLDDYLKTSFHDIQTKCYLSSENPLQFLLPKVDNKQQIGFSSTTLSGKHFISSNETSPFLNDLHAFFRRVTKANNDATGVMCFTCHPEKQLKLIRFFRKKLADRKYRKISQNSQQGFTHNQFLGSGKLSTNQQSIHQHDKLTRVALEYEKSKANIINHVGILLGTITASHSLADAQRTAENLLKRAQGTLGQIVNPNNENSYQFTDLSQEETEKHFSKLFFVDKYLLPYSSKCLSQELALLMRMPNKNTGLHITREERSFQPKQQFVQPTSNHFLIGTTRTENDEEGYGTSIFWSYKNLLKHTFISGATGGGKTYTICHLLLNASREGIPTIILDFGKGELFSFLHKQVPNLKVFTIGDDSTCPIRLNPLECPEWTTPQQHFDNLKTILDASLPQFEPLPIVTYRALSKLFTTDGWDLGVGTKGETRTLEDLLIAGLQVCEEAGYAEEVYMNMRGAWQMRIGSLLEGSIGRQLFTKKSIPIEEMVNGNTILEIRAIESTAQKISTLTFLTLIFDYFKSLGPTSEEKPRCLLILDEAESIFAAAEAFGNNVEMVTPAFKAVQKLNQILRQGRAFGLAVVIATQSPTNISHEIIANTENKIVHRLHHGRDKQVIQEALELTNTQTAKLSSLKPGECYAVDSVNEFPYFMKVIKLSLSGKTLPIQEKNQLMKQHMEGFYQKFPWMREVYQGSPEKEFDRLFDRAVTSVEQRMKLDPYTRKRIDLVQKRGVFTDEIKDLVKEFIEEEIEEETFYEKLLEILHNAAMKVIGEKKEELREVAMELIRSALYECSFLNHFKRQDILETIQALVYIDGGR
ncbi:MAG: ATP-binding protein [Asgard group archaeon]|nr:ATP-binding protein [Asgard group archaeon]